MLQAQCLKTKRHINSNFSKLSNMRWKQITVRVILCHQVENSGVKDEWLSGLSWLHCDMNAKCRSREPGRRNIFEIKKDGFCLGISKCCYAVGSLDKSVKLRLNWGINRDAIGLYVIVGDEYAHSEKRMRTEPQAMHTFKGQTQEQSLRDRLRSFFFF